MKNFIEIKSNYIYVKRVMDIFLSFMGIITISPLLLIIAILIKITNGGPIFYSQTRVGYKGKLFKSIKFRTMRVESIDNPPCIIGKDQRVTFVGKLLRKTFTDELPMLFSVLVGDISLCGPHIAMPFEIQRYSDNDWKRLSLKPGLTGYWQVYGKRLDWGEMIQMDIEYIEKLSFLLDLKILLKTVLVVLFSKEKY